MIRHRQQPHVPGLTPGNCVQCCIASILDEPVLDRIPHVAWLDPKFSDDSDVAANPHAWWGILQDAVARYGCTLHCVGSPSRAEALGEEMFPLSRLVSDTHELVGAIGCGSSPRGPWGHAVVVDEHGQLLHDPHPSGVGVPFLDEAWLIIRPAGDEVAV